VNRRLFMAGAAVALSAPKLLLAGGMGMVEYAPGLIKEPGAAPVKDKKQYSVNCVPKIQNLTRISVLS